MGVHVHARTTGVHDGEKQVYMPATRTRKAGDQTTLGKYPFKVVDPI